ncbi:thioredoxin family protein [Bacteroidota bacterium]
MLITNLKHIMTTDEHNKFIEENENVMICCGRMGPMCIPVYGVMEELENEYSNVKFADMEFDNPEAHVIRNAPECSGFMGLPFVVYYRNGELVKATSGIQSIDQIQGILDQTFKQPVEG